MATIPQAEVDEIRSAMARTNELFHSEVFVKRNFDAIDEIYTAEATILPPGAPMTSGRAAIKAFWKGLIETVNATSAVLASVAVKPAGDGIVEIGTATLAMHPDGQPASELAAKYVVYWRQEDGRWKWDVDIWN